jgi:Holliday junction resolvase
MKIGEVGVAFESTTKITYKSDRTFIDFDFIILDYQYILANQTAQDGPAFLKRKTDLIEFIEHKRIPLIIIAPNPQFTIFSFGKGLASLSDILPVKPFDVTKESGEKIQIIANTHFSNFFTKYISYFYYTSYFTKFEGNRLLETPHTKKTVSFINDKCLFLPALRGKLKNDEQQFLTDLFDLIKPVKNGSLEIELPKWASNYLLPGETEIVSDIKKCKTQLIELTSALNEKEKDLAQLNRKKLLITSTGKQLENEIKNILIEIGFEIIEAEESRDDLIVKYGENIAVIEIKGVSGSSAEKHAAQLEKWVTTFYERTDMKPKGILLVNGYRDKEPKDRPVEIFPHQMLKFSIQREHCLLTTPQLLALFFEIKINESRKSELIQTLFETNGVYNKFTNWQDLLSLNIN